MGDKTKISWCDASWNVVTGCRHISAGCDHCYAAAFAVRFDRDGDRWDGLTNRDHRAPRWNGEVKTYPKRLGEPLKWTRGRDIFPCSMSDLGYEEIPDEIVAAMFGVMAASPWHRYLIVTKRSATLRSRIKRFGADPVRHCLDAAKSFGVDIGEADMFPPAWPLPNVLLGATVENQAATARLDDLFKIPVAGYFASVEPMIGPIDFEHVGNALFDREKAIKHMMYGGASLNRDQAEAYIAQPQLCWVIIGGESGYRARPMAVEWALDLVKQCDSAGVPVFVKQLGGH